MQYDQKQFTQKGLNMFTSALSQKQPIVIDKVIVDDLPTNNFSNLALLSMDSFADALSYQANYTTVNGNMLTVDAVMSNKDFNSSYTINEVGLVGHINNDMSSQALIAVLVASDPFTLPAQQSGETPSQFIPNITLSFGDNNMNQVPVMVSDSAYIAQKDLDRLISEYNYLKVGDADSRYVKQNDFQNEVNNSVNEKADKSYVDQNYNNSVKDNHDGTITVNDTKLSTNANLTPCDLNDVTNAGIYYSSSMMNAYENAPEIWEDVSFTLIVTSSSSGDIYQEMISPSNSIVYRTRGWGNWQNWSQISTQKDLNSMYDSLNKVKEDENDAINKFNHLSDVKADSGDTQGKINQTLNQAVDHSNQNLESANNHSDTNYSNLSSQTNEKFNQAISHSDSHYNDLLQNKIEDNHDGTAKINGNNISLTKVINPCDLNDIVTAGYYTSESYLNQYQNIPSDVFAVIAFNLIVITSGNDITQEIHASGTNPMFRKKAWGSWGNWHQIATDDDIKNKANDLSNQIISNKSTTDQQFNQNNSNINSNTNAIDNNYNNIINNQSSINNITNNLLPQNLNQATAHADQNYNNSVKDNHDGTIQANGGNISLMQSIDPCDLNNLTTTGLYASSSYLSQYQNAPLGSYNMVKFNINVITNGQDIKQEIQASGMSPVFRQKSWGNWNSWHQTATEDDIASIKANAWRELNVAGITNFQGGHILCKIDWNNNVAILEGGLQLGVNAPNGDTLTIYSSNDFNFKDGSVYAGSGQNGTVQNGNISIAGFNNTFNNTLNFGISNGSGNSIPITSK